MTSKFKPFRPTQWNGIDMEDIPGQMNRGRLQIANPLMTRRAQRIRPGTTQVLPFTTARRVH